MTLTSFQIGVAVGSALTLLLVTGILSIGFWLGIRATVSRISPRPPPSTKTP